MRNDLKENLFFLWIGVLLTYIVFKVSTSFEKLKERVDFLEFTNAYKDELELEKRSAKAEDPKEKK